MCIRSPAVTPARSMEPVMAPADVPTMMSAVRGSHCVASSPARRESPRGRRRLRTPPAPRTSPMRTPAALPPFTPHIGDNRYEPSQPAKPEAGGLGQRQLRRQAAGPRIRPQRRSGGGPLGPQTGRHEWRAPSPPLPRTRSTGWYPAQPRSCRRSGRRPSEAQRATPRERRGRSAACDAAYSAPPGEVQLARMSAAMRPVPLPER